MKNFLILICAWLVQDILQIIMTQTFLPPEVFMIVLMACVTNEPVPRNLHQWLAVAILGGLMTDLRWFGIPGLCAVQCIVAMLCARWCWFSMPESGRRMLPYVLITILMCLLSAPLRLFFWHSSVTEGRVFLILAVHWVSSIIVTLAVALFRGYSSDEPDY